jgi:hypothetical protein
VNDPLEELLRPPAPDENLAALQNKLLGRTLALLPARRRWRRLALAASLAAAFLLGALAMGLYHSGLQPEERPVVVDRVPEKPKTAPREAPAPAPRTLAQTAVTTEWQAFDSKERRGTLYVQAGDKYLREQGDIASALRCYRQGLAAASPRELEVRAEDDWLVMALKTSRRKEMENAKNLR